MSESASRRYVAFGRPVGSPRMPGISCVRSEAVLEPEVPERAGELGLPGRSTLSFETARHPVLLSGRADAGPIPGTLRFWVTDDVGVRPLRLRSRLNVDFAVRVAPLNAGGRRKGFPAERVTLDVSAGGIRIAGHHAPAGSLLAIELTVPGLPHAVTCTARAVRVVPGGTAVTFCDLDPGVQATLDRLILAVRRRVARDAFAAAKAKP
jgi:hypothetical protein